MASTENIIGAPSLLTKTEYEALNDVLKKQYQNIYGKGSSIKFHDPAFTAAKRALVNSATKGSIKKEIGS